MDFGLDNYQSYMVKDHSICLLNHWKYIEYIFISCLLPTLTVLLLVYLLRSLRILLFIFKMNLERANLAIKVAIDKANEVGGKYCIAVLDAGVNLVAFNRMDGGRVGTIDVAMKKVTFIFPLFISHILS